MKPPGHVPVAYAVCAARALVRQHGNDDVVQKVHKSQRGDQHVVFDRLRLVHLKTRQEDGEVVETKVYDDYNERSATRDELELNVRTKRHLRINGDFMHDVVQLVRTQLVRRRIGAHRRWLNRRTA